MSILKRILQKILENIQATSTKGVIIASPSNNPPYQYHWIRDSALVMRPIIQQYKNTLDDSYYRYIIDYINIECTIQNINTLAGLGEPKINIDGTPYNGPWGRPQNDGPALRSLRLFEIKALLGNSAISDILIKPMIVKDTLYIISNYNKPSFDLWEENFGWHFYTRMVQLKALKEAMIHCEYIEIPIEDIRNAYTHLLHTLSDHICGDSIISSFDTDGNIVKYHDCANILAFLHIDCDEEILHTIPLAYIIPSMKNLEKTFYTKYAGASRGYIGRYENDTYYGGQAWILCTLALIQMSILLNSVDFPINNYITLLDDILMLDPNLLLSEQYDPVENKFLSAEKLTWNYSELYITINLKNKLLYKNPYV